jgi:1-acylglycerone phosphate reductase
MRVSCIGSTYLGIMPVPFSAAYDTSKAALHSFCDTTRVELAPFKYNYFLWLE